MSIVSRIKKRLPIMGSQAEPPRPSSPSPMARVVEDEPLSARGDKPVSEFIDGFVKGNPVAIFMKGSPTSPMCGFSARAASILFAYNKPFAHFNVLQDDAVREGVKEYSHWPTIPQIYIGGEFIGGSDILAQMHDSGELREAIDAAFSASAEG